MAVQHEVEPETSEPSDESNWSDYGVQTEVPESTQEDPRPEFE